MKLWKNLRSGFAPATTLFFGLVAGIPSFLYYRNRNVERAHDLLDFSVVTSVVWGLAVACVLLFW